MSGEPLELHAGAVRLDLEGADLRGLDLGAGPVVQRVYPAFRDSEWRTAPIEVRRREVERRSEEFSLRLEGTARLAELELGWVARADGASNGTVTYSLEVEATSSFAYRRLGLCVHFDAAACAGARAAVDGDREAVTLGELIAPQPRRGEEYLPILGPFTELTISLADGSRLELATGGAAFELEDQRNWADSTLKAYSSGPARLSRGRAGDRWHQSVRLRPSPAPRRAPRRRQPLTVGAPTAVAVPPVGVGAPAGWSLPAGLAPAHVRFDVRLGQAEAADPRPPASADAAEGPAVELAVHGSAADRPVLPEWCREARLARVLALDRSEASTSPELLALVATAIGRECPIAVGTGAHFSEVCRLPPLARGADFLCWSAHPQVHAGDDRSVIENLPALSAQVRTALALRPRLRPLVSELRLGPRGRPDPRGSSSFGSAWAVGAFAQLLGAGAAAVTVAGGPGQEAVLAVAAIVMSARGAPLRTVTGESRGIAALAWGEPEPRLLLANLEPAERRLAVELPCGRDELRLGPYEVVGVPTAG